MQDDQDFAKMYSELTYKNIVGPPVPGPPSQNFKQDDVNDFSLRRKRMWSNFGSITFAKQI